MLKLDGRRGFALAYSISILFFVIVVGGFFPDAVGQGGVVSGYVAAGAVGLFIAGLGSIISGVLRLLTSMIRRDAGAGAKDELFVGAAMLALGVVIFLYYTVYHLKLL